MNTARTMQSKRDIWEIQGDRNRGVMSGVNMTKTALCKPVVYYSSAKYGIERFLTLDVYQVGEEPPEVYVYCPICQMRDPNNDRNMSLRIRAERKNMDIRPNALPRHPGISHQELVQHLGLGSLNDIKGVISIDPFKCTWEEEAEQNKGASGIGGGLISACCDWQVKIVNNVAIDCKEL